jgi:hypothetical protein
MPSYVGLKEEINSMTLHNRWQPYFIDSKMKKYRNQTILVWISFLIGLLLIYYLFIYLNLVSNLDQKITFIIASFGILFSITQFWFSSIHRKTDFIRNMRYEEYRKVREVTNNFFFYLNENMLAEPNIHLLVRQLIKTKYELTVIIQMSNKTILPGILDNESVKRFGQVSDEIITKTDKLRSKLDILVNKRTLAGSGVDTEIEIEKMNWHNDILGNLVELHELKYHIFSLFEKEIIY